jgi:hypothetical protein
MLGRIGLCVTAVACGRIGFDGGTSTADGASSDGQPAIADLVAWFSLDGDPTAGTADALGSGIVGTCVAQACPVAIAGVRDGAYRFDGTDDVVTFPVVEDLALPVATFTVWVRFDTIGTSGKQHLISKPYGALNKNSFELFLLQAATANLGAGGDAASASFASVSWSYPTGAWHHVAMAFDGTGDVAAIGLFVDGVRVDSATFSAVFDANAVLLGADYNGGSYASFLAGALDDVRVYKRVLDPAEIAILAEP